MEFYDKLVADGLSYLNSGVQPQDEIPPESTKGAASLQNDLQEVFEDEYWLMYSVLMNHFCVSR